jgi:hypothetical protein
MNGGNKAAQLGLPEIQLSNHWCDGPNIFLLCQVWETLVQRTVFNGDTNIQAEIIIYHVGFSGL